MIAHTPDPEGVVANAARLCYTSAGIDNLLEENSPELDGRYIRMLASMGHESPFEHASFTFAVEGVSRSLLAQLTRHRIASFSVQSQRYVRLDDAEFIIPPVVEADSLMKSRYQGLMNQLLNYYCSFAEELEDKHAHVLIEQGMDEDVAYRNAEKMANEDARFILPNACATKIIFTMNARSLNHFFALRCCNRAQWEIRELATKVLWLVYPIAPNLFANAGPDCVRGQCSEGKMCCGKANEVREHFQSLKEECV